MSDDFVSDTGLSAPEQDELAVVSDRQAWSRQRPLAAIVVGSAILVVIGLTAGPWARTTFPADSADEERSLDIDLDASGGVHVREGDPELVDRYNDSDNELQRTVLEESVPGSSRELARVLAVLLAVIAGIGLVRDLTPHSWVLVAALALGCLVTVVMLRDEVISTLATSATSMNLGEPHTRPTFWGALAVGASAAATLGAGFAAAPRPADIPMPEESQPPSLGRRRIGWPTRGRRNRF